MKVNKEGVDKRFLMEFVHVMGKREHTLEDFGDVGGGGEPAEDSTKLPGGSVKLTE